MLDTSNPRIVRVRGRRVLGKDIYAGVSLGVTQGDHSESLWGEQVESRGDRTGGGVGPGRALGDPWQERGTSPTWAPGSSAPLRLPLSSWGAGPAGSLWPRTLVPQCVALKET